MLSFIVGLSFFVLMFLPAILSTLTNNYIFLFPYLLLPLFLCFMVGQDLIEIYRLHGDSKKLKADRDKYLDAWRKAKNG
jgi:hypothetical protein